MQALLEEIESRRADLSERQDQRAGLIAAELRNNNPWRKGSRTYSWEDFFQKPVKILTPKQLREELSSWASRVNSRFEA